MTKFGVPNWGPLIRSSKIQTFQPFELGIKKIQNRKQNKVMTYFICHKLGSPPQISPSKFLATQALKIKFLT